MLTEVNSALKDFIEAGLKNLEGLKVNFDLPDSRSPSTSNSTINVFLYDIREDLNLRSYKPSYAKLKSRDDTLTGGLVQATKGIALSYIITVWIQRESSFSNTEDNASTIHVDESQVLSSLINLFLYYPNLPKKDDTFNECLTTLSNLSAKIQILHPYHLQSPAEFWNMLGGKPKPMIHLTVTIPAPPNVIETHDVTSATTSIGNIK